MRSLRAQEQRQRRRVLLGPERLDALLEELARLFFIAARLLDLAEHGTAASTAQDTSSQEHPCIKHVVARLEDLDIRRSPDRGAAYQTLGRYPGAPG
jgi:hypothetical protein